jgi:drug/metabolite transporter superfamily protein YnfA
MDNVSPVDILILIALVLAAIEQFDAKGRSLGMWAVILVCVALLWGTFLEVT